MKQPSYYAILPATIRYNPDLTMFQKILYAEITALTNAKGYCYASNSYFEKLYLLSKSTISRNINQLVKLGFLKSVIDKNNSNQRRLYPTYIPILANEHTPIPANEHTPILANEHTPKPLYKNTTRLNTPHARSARKRGKQKVDVNVEWFNEYIKNIEKQDQLEREGLTVNKHAPK